jgi:hypothetical protein
MSKIIVSVAGWCEADPDRVRFQSIRDDDTQDMYITGREWLSLDEEARDGFVLESVASAFVTALDGEYDQVDIEVEE